MDHTEKPNNLILYSLEEAFDDGTLFDLNDSIYHEMAQIIYKYPVMITCDLLDFIISVNHSKDPNFNYHEIIGEILTKSLFGKTEIIEPAMQKFKIQYDFKGETLIKELKIKSHLGLSGEPIIILSLTYEEFGY
ncbi:hypothetical protein [Leptospira interrogans]|uniref:hypothetical protein n=1 Tax=Leptospira interrogans TaxID=173 RepID=UPI0002BBB916|nr:hypothetical protein [Leptospira interrogans]MCR8649124.1 hypothetical protein [Leptospira interrogans serovar Bataviae]OAM86105.1 hypothetical protein A1343_15845 [Leptospira interrogans serovar Bataviae]QOI40463.1 hypothetical protein Lepto1548_19645 [Leptospira interrogans serovar Bataviae]